MDIRSKLGLLLGSGKELTPPTPAKSGDDFGGIEVSNCSGTFILIETTYPTDYIHGTIPLSCCTSDFSSFLDGELKEIQYIPLNQTLFLDTETTGLAGGTGTYAFLIGTGRFEKEGFVLRQYLMRDYYEELAMLESLTEVISSSKLLVSFNGKSFDWPLLQTRYTMNRMELPCSSSILHLDLLHLSRRMWKNRFDHYNLSYLEEHLLQLYRQDDIPGYLIPQRYFEYLNTKRDELLKDIITHNALDILSMVSLLGLLQEKNAQSPIKIDCPYEAEALARACLEKKLKEKAIAYLSKGLDLSGNQEQKRRILHQLGYCYKSLGQFKLAESTWWALLDVEEDYLACEELAKLYEHQTKELQKALRFARRGLAQAVKGRFYPGIIENFEHRISRLESKLNKKQSKELLA